LVSIRDALHGEANNRMAIDPAAFYLVDSLRVRHRTEHAAANGYVDAMVTFCAPEIVLRLLMRPVEFLTALSAPVGKSVRRRRYL